MKHITTSLQKKYNTPDTVVLIASFPGKKNRSIKEIDAVASYTDHLSTELGKSLAREGKKLVILAQKTGKETWYEERGILIGRVWDKGTPAAYSQILTALKNFPQAEQLLIQFEFHQFGGNLNTATFPIFLALLRLMNKRVTLVMHQVVEDISTLSGHVNIITGSLKAKIFNSALRWFYRLTALTANQIVVHNHILAKRFHTMTGRNDLFVIPHGLGAFPLNYTKSQARRKLGFKSDDYIVMLFGFMTWYKGTDWITEVWQDKRKTKGMKLLIAGGESPNIKNKPHYQQLVANIYKKAQGKDIQITGFVEDQDISLYFAACDIAVLPYRTLMSSSGPLAMTIGFKKPFLLSKTLAPYLEDRDFASAIKIAGLTNTDLTFSLREKSLLSHIRAVQQNTVAYENVAASLAESRNWKNVAQAFTKVLKFSDYISQPNSDIMHTKAHYAYAFSKSV